MRERKEIEMQALEKLDDSEYPELMLEAVLDCRDLLLKLVEKGQKTKIVTTEVPFTAHEEKLLAALPVIHMSTDRRNGTNANL